MRGRLKPDGHPGWFWQTPPRFPVAPTPRNPEAPGTVPRFSDQHRDDLDRTLRLMRTAGWVRSYSLADDNVSVAWTDKGEAALAVLRKLGLELGLARDPTIAPTTFWLAINFGPDVVAG